MSWNVCAASRSNSATNWRSYSSRCHVASNLSNPNNRANPGLRQVVRPLASPHNKWNRHWSRCAKRRNRIRPPRRPPAASAHWNRCVNSSANSARRRPTVGPANWHKTSHSAAKAYCNSSVNCSSSYRNWCGNKGWGSRVKMSAPMTRCRIWSRNSNGCARSWKRSTECCARSLLVPVRTSKGCCHRRNVPAAPCARYGSKWTQASASCKTAWLIWPWISSVR